jgi:hypothetical protein
MRHMYHTPGVTDIDKQRKDAIALSDGDSRNAPTTVRIHHHKYAEQCVGKRHEDFKAKEL